MYMYIVYIDVDFPITITLCRSTFIIKPVRTGIMRPRRERTLDENYKFIELGPINFMSDNSKSLFTSVIGRRFKAAHKTFAE